MFLASALVLAIACLTSAAANHPVLLEKVESINFKEVNGVNYRLPNNSRPNTYEISLVTRIDQANFEFTGFVRIGIVVDRATREIVLHARQLTISRISLARLSGSVPVDVRLLPHTFEIVTEFLKISTDGAILNPGDRLELDIAYTGTLRDDNAGFYRSSYISANGNKM